VEVRAAGVIALPTRGPSRYFGGDRSLAERIAATVDTAVRETAVTGTVVGEEGRQPGGGARVGVADGRFAADLAARGGQAITIVDPGGSGRWLAPVPVTALVGHDPTWRDLADLLVRLGIRTLGQLAELPGPDVLARFGPSGAAAHRLARGGDEHPLEARIPPPDLVVVAELDPPADRVDTAAFVAKALAAELQERLGSLGLACTRVAVEAETEHGETLSRLWRHDGALSAAEIAERMRWQLDDWLHSGGGTSGGLTVLRLRPDEIRPDHGRQLGFWGGSAAVDDRVARTLARVQGMLGPDGVATAVLTGGRDPFRQVQLVAWGHAGPDAARSSRRREGAAPWPGHLPGPAPTLVHDPHRGAD
ncbi:MAG: DNA polymerase Y family protein, partial [Acidimicrobiales bacterium]